MSKLRVASLFSGLGCFDRGFERAGMVPVVQCEIEESCRKVLAKYWPDVERVEDVETITDEKAREWSVDVVVGGSPCQDLSVAGVRAGLAGKRSGLFRHLVRLADASGAAWLVWENVVGALSSPPSDPGEDFATVLELVTGFRPAVPDRGWRTGGVCIGPKRSAAWRVLDALHVGGCPLHVDEFGIGPVPQRRRRIFLVARLRDDAATDGRALPSRLLGLPAEVLLEPVGVRWDPASGEQAGERVAQASLRGPGSGGADDNDGQAGRLVSAGQCHGSNVGPVGTLRKGNGNETGGVPFVAETPSRNVAQSLPGRYGSQPDFSARATPTLLVSADEHASPLMGLAHGEDSNAPGRMRNDVNLIADAAPALTLGYGDHAGQDLDRDGALVSGFDLAQVTSAENRTRCEPGDPMPGLQSTGRAHVAVTPILEPGRRSGRSTDDPRCGIGIGEDGDPSFTLNAQRPHGVAVAAYSVTPQGHREGDGWGGFADAGISVAEVDAAGTIDQRGASTTAVASTIVNPGRQWNSAQNEPNLVTAFQERGRDGGRSLEIGGDVAYALTAPKEGGRAQEKCMQVGATVRRLTPVECLRLTGLPDDYCDGLGLSDSAIYRMVGNAVVVLVAEWIGRRIVEVDGSAA